jgi:DNA-binding transcriptional LysR family regulator
MEIKWMRTFVAVAEELHFGRAAQRLHIAQPAVSQQIAGLERDMQVRLFNRDKRNVNLTDAVRGFLGPCRDILQSIEMATIQARNAGPGEFGTVRIGFNGGVTADLLYLLSNALRTQHPTMQVILDSSRRSEEILALIEEENLDIGLIGGPVVGQDLDSFALQSNKLGILLPEDHPLARRNSVPVLALKEQAFVLVAPAPGWTLRTTFENVCADAGFYPRSVAEVRDGLSVLLFVNARVGIGVACSSTTLTNPSGITFRPLADDVTVATSIVWKKGTKSTTVPLVLACARDRLRGPEL